MIISDTPDRLKRLEIPGRVSVLEGQGELTKVEVNTDWSSAEVYMHGAHVTDFRRKGEPPILFTSQCSRFTAGHAIRGGVPVILPWFGAREGSPMHGFARTAEWELHEVTTVPDGGVSLRFRLPEVAEGATWPPFYANYVVTVTDRLQLELIVTNASPDVSLTLENCLHSYFTVGNISETEIVGLRGVTYLDKLENFVPKVDSSEAIRINAEVDRIYLDARGPVEIRDRALRRVIRVEKTGSSSTVVWNPWIAKAQQMPDFGSDEYQQMVCVESGNVSKNRLVLPPGKTSVLQVILSSAPI